MPITRAEFDNAPEYVVEDGSYDSVVASSTDEIIEWDDTSTWNVGVDPSPESDSDGDPTTETEYTGFLTSAAGGLFGRSVFEDLVFSDGTGEPETPLIDTITNDIIKASFERYENEFTVKPKHILANGHTIQKIMLEYCMSNQIPEATIVPKIYDCVIIFKEDFPDGKFLFV